MGERIAIDYRHTTVYFETPLNAVGATDSLTLRDAPAALGANDAYVKKFGTVYPITDMLAGSAITVPRSDGGGVNSWQWEFNAWDAAAGIWRNIGTLRDTLGGSVFTDGVVMAVAAPMVMIQLTVIAGSTALLVDGDTITMNTDIDGGGLTVVLPGENVTAASADVVLGLSSSGSTYYSTNDMVGAPMSTEMKVGGGRHTPALNDVKYPYRTFETARAAVFGAGGTIVEVIDSETYDVGRGQRIDAGFTYQTSLGQTPTVTSGVGARHSRTPDAEYNNATALYVSPHGSDADPGTWQEPFQSLIFGYAAALVAGVPLVIGGDGAGTDPMFYTSLAMGAAGTLEADHETIGHIEGTNPIIVNAAGCIVRNIDATCTSNSAAFYGNAGPLDCEDCSGHGGSFGFQNSTGDPSLVLCRASNTYTGIVMDGTTGNPAIQHCDMISCANNGLEFTVALGGTTSIINNVISDCFRGIFMAADIANANGLNQTTIYNCIHSGLYISIGGALASLPFALIITDCENGIYANVGGMTITINRCSIDNNTNPTAGAGAAGITQNNARVGDPLLCEPTNNRFGVQPNSTSYHANGVGNDCGALRSILTTAGANATVDNLTFDGQGAFLHAIYQEVTRAGWTVKWCSFENLGGIAVDPYGTAATNASIANCLVDSCGAGIALSHTGNTIAETIVFATSSIGIWIGNTGNVLDHISIHGGRYGLYLTAAASFVLRDTILSFQSVLAIYSAVGQIISFCCIDGAVSTNIDVTSPTNVLSQPFFLSTIAGSEDLRLWSIANGFPLDSPCIDAASDGYDMGAYLVARGVTDESWETYVLDETAIAVNEGIVPKRETGFETVLGSQSLAAKTHKRRVDLSWPTDTAAENEQFRHVIELFNTFVEDDHQGWTSEQIILRLHLRPTEYMLDVFDGTVDASELTIYDATAAWDRNAYRGYDATCRWYHSTIGILDAVAETIVVAGAAWVIDEWAGYWFRQDFTEGCSDHAGDATTITIGYRWFRILSNTVDTITFSDPYNLSVAVVAGFEFWIVSWHKIASNNAQYMCLEDEDSDLLRDGEADVYVDILRTRLTKSGVSVRGALEWSSDQQRERVPDRLRLEEI